MSNSHHIGCFNSSMVRLRGKSDAERKELETKVSIPVWYD